MQRSAQNIVCNLMSRIWIRHINRECLSRNTSTSEFDYELSRPRIWSHSSFPTFFSLDHIPSLFCVGSSWMVRDVCDGQSFCVWAHGHLRKVDANARSVKEKREWDIAAVGEWRTCLVVGQWRRWRRSSKEMWWGKGTVETGSRRVLRGLPFYVRYSILGAFAWSMRVDLEARLSRNPSVHARERKWRFLHRKNARVARRNWRSESSWRNASPAHQTARTTNQSMYRADFKNACPWDGRINQCPKTCFGTFSGLMFRVLGEKAPLARSERFLWRHDDFMSRARKGWWARTSLNVFISTIKKSTCFDEVVPSGDWSRGSQTNRLLWRSSVNTRLCDIKDRIVFVVSWKSKELNCFCRGAEAGVASKRQNR